MLGVLEEEAGKSAGRSAIPSEDLWGVNRSRFGGDERQYGEDSFHEEDYIVPMDGTWVRAPHAVLQNRKATPSPLVTVANLHNLLGGSWQFDG